MAISIPPKGDADKKIGANFAPLSVVAQDTPNMTVKVRAGWFYNTSNAVVEYTGGNSPTFSAPVSNAVWAVVSVNDSGSIVLTYGTPAVTPALPTIPGMPLAFVYLTSTTTVITNDKVFDARPLYRGVDLTAALASYTTFVDLASGLATKADLDGTSSTDFAVNKGAVSGVTSTFSVQRGGSPTVALRWNEGTGKWQFTNDGTTYNDMVSVVGTFMAFVSGPTAGHVLTTDGLGQAVDGGVALAALETVAAATASLALKADKVVAAVAGDVATLNGSGNLVDGGVLLSALATTAALALKADDSAVVHNTGIETIAGAKTFSSNVTINDGPVGTPTMEFGNFSGDMGLEVARAAFPANPALFKWDETSVTWQVGIVGGPVDSILTASVVSGKVDRTDTLQLTGEVTLGPSALTGPANSFAASLSTTGVGAASHGAADTVATFTVDTKGRLTAAGDATIAITGAAVTVGGFTNGHVVSLDVAGHLVDSGVVAANVLVTGDIGSTVEAFDASILKSADIGSTVEAWSAELDAVAAVATTGFVRRTGVATWSASDLTGSEVNTALGYTAADDSTVVHLAGSENITGSKTFKAATTVQGDGTNPGLQVTAANNIALGLSSDPIAANDGFPYIPYTTTTGAPSGTPSAIAGFAPMIVQNDTGTFKLWVYIPAVGWKSTTLA